MDSCAKRWPMRGRNRRVREGVDRGRPSRTRGVATKPAVARRKAAHRLSQRRLLCCALLLVLPAIPGRHAFASEEAATLTAADGASEDYFGGSVAVSGDTALVGAPEDDVAHWDQGSTAVFRWNGSAWIEEAKLLASDAEDLDDFGTSVALVGDVALVGASLGKVVDYHGTNAAYVFRRNGSIWVEETKLIPS